MILKLDIQLKISFLSRLMLIICYHGQPPVSHATVDLASETAFVWLVAEAKITPNWREELGEALAKHLTTCGFSSKAQGQCHKFTPLNLHTS